MDIVRTGIVEKKKKQRIIAGSIGFVALAGITLGIAQLKPAAPVVERSTVWVDVVKRGPMLRQVRGTGTLVPEIVRWIPAATEARVEKVLVQPGEAVNPDTVLLELSDPEQVQRTLNAELQLRAAESEYVNLEAELESERLRQEAEAARLKAEYEAARLRANADEALAKEQLLPEITRKISQQSADELRNRYELEQRRIIAGANASRARLAARRSQVQQLRSMYELQRTQLASLQVRAGIKGVLQQIGVEVGQRVPAGTILAKAVDVTKLKAQLRVAETQAKDIQPGQQAVIDTRNGVVKGHVMRVDPAVQNGTVTVDVALDEALPKGARPDLTVDGTVELERLDNILFVNRPVHAQELSAGSIFKLEPDGSDAVRVKVQFGRGSVSTIEVTDGLAEGDRVILSDMSAWNENDRIRLN